MGDFKKLKVWQKSHQLTLEVYKSTTVFPDRERFGLTGQLRRAAASIPANVAEGCGRGTDNELVRYVRIGLGSATGVSPDSGQGPGHSPTSSLRVFECPLL